MILEELFLNNFGVYRGEHAIELAPKSKKSPVILVGGLNGGGKTTILDAIQLVLFGKFAKCSTRGNLAYEDFLRKCITRGEDPKEGAFIQLNFSYYFDGKKANFEIIRSWREGRTRINEKFEVFRSGVLDEGLTENWFDQVDQFLPMGLAELFFFDGEKIARLAESDNAAEMLNTAINTLLGIDLVDRLEKDLVTYEKEIRESGKAELNDEVVTAFEQEREKLEQQILQLAQQKGQLHTELERLNNKLHKAEDEFRRHGGELFSQRKELEASSKELSKQLKRIEGEMRFAAAAESPLALVEKELNRIKGQVLKEEEAKKQNMLLEELDLRDREILQLMKSDEISSLARMTLGSLFQADIEKRRKAANTPIILGLSEGVAKSVCSLNSNFFKTANKVVQSLLQEYSTTHDRLSRVEEKLEQVPDEGAISEQGKALAELRAVVIRKEAELKSANEQLDELKKKLNECEVRLRRELEKQLSNHAESAILKRKLSYATRTRETMRQFRTVVLKRKIKQIEDEILGCFQQLLRKKSLIGGVRIDPDTYRMELKGHKFGETIPTNRLSAGERQLFAISTLWGLARVSGRPLPNIIDTPLGRLDSKHRSNLVDNYFPHASHQVIILSTDEEINQSYLDRIKKHIGRSYELLYCDKSASTEIRDGYFF